MTAPPSDRQAVLYRMVMPDHICPWGLKARALLKRKGYEVEDHPLRSEAETEAFKARHEVETTPQIFIGGWRIGGYDDLRRHLGLAVADPDRTSYRPVVAIFLVALLMAGALAWSVAGTLWTGRLVGWFLSISMCVLAIQKLQDLESFSTMFLNYDLLARRWVPHAYLYPFGEALAGILMLGGLLPWIAGPVALFIGGVGAASVFRAVYVDHRELRCACVGGNSRVPLGFVSLTENLTMVAMGLWTMGRALGA